MINKVFNFLKKENFPVERIGGVLELVKFTIKTSPHNTIKNKIHKFCYSWARLIF